MIGALGGALIQNPAILGQAAQFAPQAPRVATRIALQLAGVSADDASALEREGVPAWALILVGLTAGAALGVVAAKRYPAILRSF